MDVTENQFDEKQIVDFELTILQVFFKFLIC